MSKVDEDLIKRLKALGYIEGGFRLEFRKEPPIDMGQLAQEIKANVGLEFVNGVNGHMNYESPKLEIVSKKKLADDKVESIKKVVSEHDGTPYLKEKLGLKENP